jgi:DNA-binding response OmpR family regulator
VASEARRSQPVVMMVEDDPAIAEMYRVGLREARYEAVALADAGTLFEALDDLIPDVIVLDWKLAGGITGGDTLKLLRRDRRTRGVPVVFLSNSESADVYHDDPQLRGQAIAWLVKANTPPPTLAMHLRDALNRYSGEEPHTA